MIYSTKYVCYCVRFLPNLIRFSNKLNVWAQYLYSLKW